MLCDVVPIEATHILLGRSWQHDRKTLHDDLSNKISFHFQGHKIILKPLSPKEVNKDQIKMKQKRKYEKDEENNKTGLITSPNVVKIVMLIHPKITIVGSLRYSHSFSCSSIHSSNYMQHLLEKVENIFQNPSKGLHI